MRVGLENMDPVIAKALAEKLCGSREQFLSEQIIWGKVSRRDLVDDGEDRPKRRRKPTSEEKYARLLRQKRDDMVARRLFYFAMPTILAAVTVGCVMKLGFSRSMSEVLATAGVISIVGLGLGSRWAGFASQRRALDYEVILEELKAALPYLTLTRAERVYCDNLVMLSGFEANLEARREIRRLLPQLNMLLADSRVLEKQRKNLLPALGSNPVKELREELLKLEQRVTEAKDDVTRSSLVQSLEMVKTRIDNSQNLEQALERINAQQEAIVNALAGAQGALARLQVAPSIQAETASREITEMVTQMNTGTVAVEQAVQEIMGRR